MQKLLLILGIFSLVFATSCSSSKKLKSERDGLVLEVEKLNKKNEELTLKATTLQSEKATALAAKKACEINLKSIKSRYSAYQAKLNKMKAELKAAFPKNLNEPNFEILEEDGRLVILLPNKILYRSGSADFDSKALDVTQKLAKVFKNNQGLQILVEGHTDEIPLKKGSKYEDNWDLSMARAVKIVRQLETYGVHPARLTAAGRGYFAPRNKTDSDEARAENRRTEIIIRPKIAELLKLMSGL